MTKRFWVSVGAIYETDDEEEAYGVLNLLRTMVGSGDGAPAVAPVTPEETGPVPGA